MFKKTSAWPIITIACALNITSCAEVAHEITKNVVCNSYCNLMVDCDRESMAAKQCGFVKEPISAVVSDCVLACENVLDQETTYTTRAVASCLECYQNARELNPNMCASDASLAQVQQQQCKTVCSEERYTAFYEDFDRYFVPATTCPQ